MASVPATAGLDEVLARLLRSTEPLAVTGDDDEFLGMLSRSKVVELVTPVIEGVTPMSNDEASELVESTGAVSDRSEEHTSELQSLMRISYAVFCLNKKKQH